MSAADFSSGPWTGFFTYNRNPRKWGMDLSLSFENGRMTGEGHDSVGSFVIAGAYDASSKECHWTKTYVGAHDVFYKGFREGKGIWGTWVIASYARGGFHIWPKGANDGENAAEYEEQLMPEKLGVAEVIEADFPLVTSVAMPIGSGGISPPPGAATGTADFFPTKKSAGLRNCEICLRRGCRGTRWVPAILVEDRGKLAASPTVAARLSPSARTRWWPARSRSRRRHARRCP